MRAKSLLAVVILAAIGVNACGSSSKGATGSVTSAPGSSTQSTGSSSGATTTIKLKGSSSSNFCDAARDDSKAFNPSGASTLSAGDLKKDYENLGPALQHIEDIAPSAIKGDFKVFVDAFEPYLKALTDANYDFTKIDVSKLQGLESAKVEAASQHITQYMTQVCGVTTPAT